MSAAFCNKFDIYAQEVHGDERQGELVPFGSLAALVMILAMQYGNSTVHRNKGLGFFKTH